MALFGGGGFYLTIEADGVGMEVLNEQNHSAGYGAECTLEEFVAGSFHDEARRCLGEDKLRDALAVARALLAKRAK